MNTGFLPITKEELISQGIQRPDFVYVIGDAYVDHPSFGHAIISRVLHAHGYSVGIIAQPDWRDENSIDRFGEPKLGFLVTAGNMDSKKDAERTRFLREEGWGCVRITLRWRTAI